MTSAKSLADDALPVGIHTGNRDWWESNPMTYDWEQTLHIQSGSREWYDEIDRRFLESAYYSEGPEGAFRRFLHPELVRGKKVLEIGCGMGLHSELMACAGAHVSSIDLSPTSVETT